MVAFPKRSKPFYSYVPLVSVVALFWWITGLGLWIHYTMVAQNNSKDYIAILQVAVDSGVASKTNQIYNSMIATSIVFALFAVCIHALGIWRGLVEAEQDVGGQVDDFSNDWIMYANVATQIAWWVIVLWLTVLLTGFGAFAALIYTVKSGTANILAMQALITASGAQVLPILPGYCPTACLSILPTGLFIYSGQDQSTLTLCVCDAPTLNSALDAITKANNAVPGMLVGVLFMVAYGIVLLAYLVAMLTRTNTEQGLSERLLSQGWTESAAPNRTVATRRG